MKTSKNILANTEKNFTVSKKETNNYNALLPNVLYNEMEQFVKKIISTNTNFVSSSPQLYKLQILKNAYFNDTLILKAQVKKLDKLELHLLITVKEKNSTVNNTICKALFKFDYNNKIAIAS